jgi:dCTP deaminase
MLLSYDQLVSEILNQGVIRGSNLSMVQPSSIDIRLGNSIQIEMNPNFPAQRMVSLSRRGGLTMMEVDISLQPYYLQPGEFILAHSQEKFYLPNNISAEYKMKSSMARIGLNHLTACWCDPGWHDSVLTMELQNVTRHHTLEVRAGDSIGQMVFFKHEPVPPENSYAAVGRYNGDHSVVGIKL